MEKYPFETPILNEASYHRAVEYTALRSLDLAYKVLGQKMGIDTVTIFTHDQQEYEFIDKLLRQKGKVSEFTHGKTLYVEVNDNIAGQKIFLLGVRQPDADRPEIGYADYPVKNYQDLKKLNESNPFVSEIKSGNGISLLELIHPDFDVRGYIVEASRSDS